MGYDPDRISWDFADETVAQLNSNNSRFYAFEPALSRVVNTDRCNQSFFGLYGINSYSHLVELVDGKAEALEVAILSVKA